MNLNDAFGVSHNDYTITPTHMYGIKNYASYQPESVMNQQIQQENKLTSSWKHRQYLQNNANQIMKYNTMEYMYSSGNNPHVVCNKTPSKNVPYVYKNIHDTSSPAFGLNNSDLKREYMMKESMNARMIAPSIPTNF
jgi:hypothetical protein